MNAKQALKMASKHIADLEDFNRRATIDNKAYNKVIEGMIRGESPCPWCNDYQECQLQAKDGKGCEDWFLTMEIQEQGVSVNAENADSETVDNGGSTDGEGTPHVEGAAGTL